MTDGETPETRDLETIAGLLKDYRIEGTPLVKTVEQIVHLLDARRRQVERLEEEVRYRTEEPWVDVGHEATPGGQKTRVALCPKDVRAYVEDLRQKLANAKPVLDAAGYLVSICGELGDAYRWPRLLEALPDLVAAWWAYPEGDRNAPLSEAEIEMLNAQVRRHAPWMLKVADLQSQAKLGQGYEWMWRRLCEAIRAELPHEADGHLARIYAKCRLDTERQLCWCGAHVSEVCAAEGDGDAER
jgi:hypothetical protein